MPMVVSMLAAVAPIRGRMQSHLRTGGFKDHIIVRIHHADNSE